MPTATKPAGTRSASKPRQAKPVAVSEPEPLTVEAIAALYPVTRNKLAADEWAAHREAIAADREPPATPVLDWMNANDAKTRMASAAAKREKAAVPRTSWAAPDGAVWTYNGHPIVRSSTYTLASLAREHSKGLGPDGGTLNVEAFAAHLVEAHGLNGTALASSWEVTLSNGHRVGLTQPGDALPVPGELSAAQKANVTRRAKVAHDAEVAASAESKVKRSTPLHRRTKRAPKGAKAAK